MPSTIDEIRTALETRLNTARDAQDIRNAQIEYLGKKGTVTALLKQISGVAEDQRRQFGEQVNALKQWAVQAVEQRLSNLSSTARRYDIDFSLPGQLMPAGKKHILTQVEEEVESVFLSMGFDIEEGPEIEQEYYNFDALNTPADHPARDMQDTFYLAPGILLRSHTSPVQVRVMEKEKPPVRIITVGRCYRRDAQDASHFPVFHQLEGLMVEKGTHFTHLKGILTAFLE